MIWAIDYDDDKNSMLSTVADFNLCGGGGSSYKCSPLKEKRWWTWDEDQNKAGMCGKEAPLYKGYYPVCDMDDPGYSCCGGAGYCGTGPEYCDCKGCINYAENPSLLIKEPVKPTRSI